MPIKWSALKVSEALDMIEGYVQEAAEPLEQARIVAKEAKKLSNLPQYIDQGLNGVLGEIERVTGGNYSWDGKPYEGSIKRAIARVRDDIPKDALEQDKRLAGFGDQKLLV